MTRSFMVLHSTNFMGSISLHIFVSIAVEKDKIKKIFPVQWTAVSGHTKELPHLEWIYQMQNI